MSDERTEAPTPKRLQEARDEGRVARSQEVNTAAALLIGTTLLLTLGGQLISALQGMLVGAVTNLPTGAITLPWLQNLVVNDALRLAPSMGPILVGLLVTGVGVSLGQTGLLWAKKRLGFDFERLNPLQGLKRLFSMQGLVELIKALVKLAVVVWVAYGFLRARAVEMMGLVQTDFQSAIRQWADLAVSLALRVGGVYLAIALADYAYQRWQHIRNLRMTKEEVKEEHKQQEGDPRIRSRIRNQQRRMARQRMMAKVPQADVIITNPTHLAVAVQYDQSAMRAPVVLAKGAYRIAERIVEIARKNKIPVMQNIPVARALYYNVEVDQEIPPDLYLALAEILAFVFRQRENR